MSVVSGLIKLSKLISRKGIYPFLRDEILRMPNQGSLLLVGAGGDVESYIKEQIAARNIQFKTVDIDPKRGPTILGDIQKIDLGENIYDLVLIVEVLEHLISPVGALATVRRALKTNGRVALTVPFIFPLHDRPNDFFRYTKYGLAKLLESYNQATILERGSWPETVFVLLIRLLYEGGRKKIILGSLFLILYPLFWPLFWVGAKIFPSDFLCLGYLATASK